MTLKLIAGAHKMLPRIFFFSSLVNRASVQHGPSPTGLTHLGLTASLEEPLRHGSGLLPPHPVVSRPEL